MASLLAVLEDKRQALEAERAELMTKAEAAGSFDDVRERIEEIDTELPAVVADRDRAAAEKKRIISAPVAYTEGKEGPITPAQEQFTAWPAAPSQQFLGSAEWTDYMARIAPGGRDLSPKVRVESPKVPLVGSPLAWMRKGAEVITGSSATSAGATVVPDRLSLVDQFYQRPITLLDLLTSGTTDSDIVEYVRVTSFTGAAASVKEATHIDLADEAGGGISHKPWAEMALAKVTEAVGTIAVGIPATKRALSDAGQMRTLIDSALRYDLQLETERQVIEGSGSDDEFEGIDTVGGTQDQTFNTSIVYTLRLAKTKVRTVGRAIPNGIVMNPTDLDLLYYECLTSTAPGMAAILTELAAGRIHGLPLVESEAVTAGSAWVADWRKAFLWDRQQASIQATDGYMDFFMRNMVAILAELRAAFGVIRPAAFVEAVIES